MSLPPHHPSISLTLPLGGVATPTGRNQDRDVDAPGPECGRRPSPGPDVQALGTAGAHQGVIRVRMRGQTAHWRSAAFLSELHGLWLRPANVLRTCRPRGGRATQVPGGDGPAGRVADHRAGQPHQRNLARGGRLWVTASGTRDPLAAPSRRMPSGGLAPLPTSLPADWVFAAASKAGVRGSCDRCGAGDAARGGLPGAGRLMPGRDRGRPHDTCLRGAGPVDVGQRSGAPAHDPTPQGGTRVLSACSAGRSV